MQPFRSEARDICGAEFFSSTGCGGARLKRQPVAALALGAAALLAFLATPVTAGAQTVPNPQNVWVWGLSMCAIGGLVAIGLYHLALYGVRRQPAYLYFALDCFFWSGFLFTGESEPWTLAEFIPSSDPLLQYKIHMTMLMASRPFGYRFLRTLYPQELSPWIQYITDTMPFIFIPMLWLTTDFFVARGLLLSHVIIAVTTTYTITRLAVCVRRKRDQAGLIFSGFGLAGALGIYRLFCLNGMGIHNLPVPPVEMVLAAPVILQATALVRQYSDAFERMHDLSDTLRDNNRALRREAYLRSRLERKIVRVSDEERRKLSQDLHDGLCQHLTGARLHCAILEKYMGDWKGAEQLAQLNMLLDTSVNEAYGMSRGLWPVERGSEPLGLSLENLVRQFAKTDGAKVEFRQNLHCRDCANPNADSICRIAQEAVLNAVKHARARSITVSLECGGEGRLCLTVADDGVGLVGGSPTDGGLGVEIMTHRARIMDATFDMTDAPGGGAVVRCVVPCGQSSSGRRA